MTLATGGEGFLRMGIFYQVRRPAYEEAAAVSARAIASGADWERVLNRFKP